MLTLIGLVALSVIVNPSGRRPIKTFSVPATGNHCYRPSGWEGYPSPVFISQPQDVDVNEILFRPTAQEL